MNAPFAAQIPSLLGLIGVLLQGAAVGSLIAAAVLLRAFRRRLRIKPWAVTAAWSLLGATVTLVMVIALSMIARGAQRPIPNGPADRARSVSRSPAICERSRSTSRRTAGSPISGGNARR